MSRLATLGLIIASAALTAVGQLTITTTSVPPALENQVYPQVTLQVSGDPGPIVWSFPDGAPPGFTVVSTPVGQPGTNGTFCYGTQGCSGFLVQTPVGQYAFTIEAISLSTNQKTTQNFNLVVEFPLQIQTTSLPNANANQSYATQLQGFGGTGQFTWSILSGALPPGIGLDPVSGTLAGTAPSVNGVFQFTIQLLDRVTQEKATQALTINVANGVSILTTALPNAIVNQPYSFQLQGSGNFLVWSIQSGTVFPPGFSLSSSGLITGVLTNTAILSLPVQLANGQSTAPPATRVFTLLVTLGPLGIKELTLPGATQNVPYTTSLTPVGGIPPYTWSLGTPSPAGIAIDPTSGIISGTPATAGTFIVPVILKDVSGASITQNYTLNVGNAVSITTTSLPNGSPNVPYSATLTAVGGSIPYQWTVLSGSLPPDLKLDDTGLIHGTPTAIGTFQFTAQVKDFLGGIASRAFTITIGPFLTITTTSLPGGALTQSYSQTLTAVNGTPPLAWSIASGNLPQGLQLNGATGAVSGTPTAIGNFTFDILVTDAAKATARRTFAISVVSNPVTITSTDFSGNVLQPFSQTLAATGGTPPYTWSVAPNTLPGGLQLDSATGVISGTPSPGGTTQVTFTATDTQGLTGTKNISITIVAPPTPPVSVTLGTTTQPAVALSTGTPYPLEITGFLTLTFASSAGGTDGGEARFSDGTRKVFFVVRPNTTQGLFTTFSNGIPAIITGTVAGTITLTTSMSAGGQDITPSPAPTKTISLDSAVPVISSVILQQVTGGLNVVVTGYSNTREVSSGSFTFTVSSGNTLSQATIPVQLSSAYAGWFGNASSNATGGQFKLTVPFSVTQGSAAAITRVSVTLTNTKGASAAVSSP